MAPRGKSAISAGETLGKAAQLRKQAQDLETSARVELIERVLRANLTLCGPVEEALEANGIDLEEAAQTKRPPRAIINNKKDVPCEDRLPRSATHLNLLHTTVLTKLTMALEQHWTMACLNALRPSPKKSICKQSL